MVHRRRVLLASDDAHTIAWARLGLDLVDAVVTVARLTELEERLVEGSADAVVLDAGHAAEPLISQIERMAADGAEARLLLVVEPDALPGLRLPVTVACDFAVRGCSAAELAARLRALVWPGEDAASQEIIRVEDLTINLATYQVHISGTPVEFTYQEYELFKFLLTHANRAYNRDVLLRRVWGSTYYGGARTVDVHVRRVRAKLGPELAHRLETVRNVGYLWRG